MRKIEKIISLAVLLFVGPFNLLSQYQVVYPKTEIKDETKEVIENYAKANRFIVMNKKFSDTIENLEFVGFKAIKLKDWDYAKIDFPFIVVIDTSEYKTEEDLRLEEEQRKIEAEKLKVQQAEQRAIEQKKERRKRFANKLLDVALGETSSNSSSTNDQKKVEEITEKPPLPLVHLYSNLKIHFSKDDYIMNYNGKGNGIENFEELKNSDIYIKDTVVKKYRSSKNEIYYFVTTNYNLVGVISEAEFLNQREERQKRYQKLQKDIESQKLVQMKEESKNWINGKFLDLFPDENLHVYQVKYLKIGNYESADTIACYANSFSNIPPDNISGNDFLSAKKAYMNSSYYKLIFDGFEYKKTINIYELITSKTLQLDSVYIKRRLNFGALEDWEKGVKLHPVIDKEKDAMLTNINSYKKFNRDYFKNKLKLTNYNLIDPAPLYLKVNITDGAILFKTGLEERNYSGNYISVTANLSQNQTVSVIKKNNRNGAFNTTNSYDLRVDKAKYNFVAVDFLTLETSYFSGRPSVQPTKESINNYLADELAEKFEYEYEKKNEENVKAKELQKQKNELYKKYGRRYVDAAYKGDIIVGMHEDLMAVVVSKFWQVTDRSNWKGGYRIYCYSMFDSSTKLSVHVKNKRVTYVSSY